MIKIARPSIIRTIIASFLLVAISSSSYPATAQSSSRYFPETRHTIQGKFLDYWLKNGGLAQQGYPISQEINEISSVDGKSYRVQYFERAVFEMHSENKPPYDVLLSLIGVFAYQQRYGSAPGGAVGQKVNTNSPVTFTETGKTIGGVFKAYWQQHGGLSQQGYPISNEFQEVSTLNGKVYTVQYFERAVFEWHPENAGTPYEVLLSQLGTFRYKAKVAPPAIPFMQGHKQFNPKVSDSYLVWTDVAVGGVPAGDIGGSANILAFDLRDNRLITVTDAPGDQDTQALSGSIVVWEEHGPNCPRNCTVRDILGKDLVTGAQFEVATGPAHQSSPAISGQIVAWIEYDGQTQKLLMKNLANSAVTEITSVQADSGITFGPPAISDKYVVWNERLPAKRGVYEATQIRAINIKTGVSQVVTTSKPASVGFPYPVYDVDGAYVVWTDGFQLQIVNIETGDTRVLSSGFASNPMIRGDTVVWSTGNGNSTDIYGYRLSEGASLLLVAGEGDQITPSVSGEWLAWYNESGPKSGRIGIASLSRVFSDPVNP
jgi:hypothetical protein